MDNPFYERSFCLPAKPQAVEIAFSGEKSVSQAEVFFGARLSHLAVYRLHECGPSQWKYKEVL